MSPTVFRGERVSLFLFLPGEWRVYVHVYCGDGEAKFWLEPHIEMANTSDYHGASSKEVEQVIEAHHNELKQAWDKHSQVKITHISNHGCDYWHAGQELFIPYETFPWFRDVPVGKILNVADTRA